MDIVFSFGNLSPSNSFKHGVYTRELTDNYCIVDLETTGLEARWDEIIEIAVLRVRNRKITGIYHTLVKPNQEIDSFITDLTGITNEMVAEAPKIEDVINDVFGFIGDDLIVGHNVSFDLRFLANAVGHDFYNRYADTMQISRKVYPDLPHHRLGDLKSLLDIKAQSHRAQGDCEATYNLYETMKDKIKTENISLEAVSHGKGHSLDLRKLTVTDASAVDPDNIFYGMHCCFTGKLERYTRAEAAQIVTNIGGYVDNGVTKHTDFLILGNSDAMKYYHKEKSAKTMKAEKLMQEGGQIRIISETLFYDSLSDE